MADGRGLATPKQLREIQDHQRRWHRVNNLLDEVIGDADGTTAAVERIMQLLPRLKGLDRTYAVRNLATRAMSCQHYHSPLRGREEVA